QITTSATHTGTAALNAALTTGHTVVDGDFSATWTTDAWVGTQFSSLVAADTAVYDTNNTLIASGPAQVLVANGESGIALALGDTLTYTVSGSGSASFYAPALSTLGVGNNWSDYTSEIHSNNPYGIGLQGADVIIDGQILDGEDMVLVITGTATLQGQGQTLAPNFTNEVTIEATDAAVQFGPAAVLTGTLPTNPANGFALPGYSGPLTIQPHTIALDLVELSGQANRDLAIALDPITSTLTPLESATFQANILSSQADVYTTTVSAPAGWNVMLDNSGLITATPPLGAQPGDYPILVAAQSAASSNLLWATAVHTATITPHEGIALTVAPDLLTTVPWAQTDFAFPGDDDINNGQPQVSGAAFIATITNTSSAAHIFDVQIQPNGFSSDWIILGGAGRTDSTQVALPPGGSGQLGVYISPVGLAALPAEGTQYPFDVVATAVDNAALTQSDNETFIMPAVQFAYVAAQPELIYSAPGASTSFDVTVTNVGNSTADFPLTVEMPLPGWAIIDGWTVPTLAPAEASTQPITITTPSGELGQVYVVAAGSQSGPYRPTAYVGVEMVSAEALPIYKIATRVAGPCAIGDNQVSLPAALQFLALSLTDLKQSCQAGACAPDLRDRVISGALASATHTAELSPLVTSDELLEQIVVYMAAHSDSVTLNSDMSAIGSAIVQLEGEVC
ncbi:MAG: hypothetical protein GY803_12995, partial [Chloroflexi bacterium]|nr:hypothetical protein [Chloroflexota bacterium]